MKHLIPVLLLMAGVAALVLTTAGGGHQMQRPERGVRHTRFGNIPLGARGRTLGTVAAGGAGWHVLAPAAKRLDNA